MITRLRAQNFKSWRDTGELEIAPLTGLFGTNSSGKTSILQMLLILKQTAESSDRRRVLHTGDEHSSVDLGTFFDIVHNHQLDIPLVLSLSWDLPATDQVFLSHRVIGEEGGQASFTTSIKQEAGRVEVDHFVYEFGDDYKFGMSRVPGNEDNIQYELVYSGSLADKFQDRPRLLPPPVKCYGFPEEARLDWLFLEFLQREQLDTEQSRETLVSLFEEGQAFPESVLAFERLFSRVAYLGPLREYPKPNYVWTGEHPVDVGRRGEYAVAALLAARDKRSESAREEGSAAYSGRQESRYSGRYDRPSYGEYAERQVLEWMQKMGLIHSFTLKPIAENRRYYEFVLKMSETGSEVLITEVGFGVSQILPVLVLCYYLPEGSIILLEQPEIHLHPSAQAGLADVLIDVVNSRNVQIIVESHSEHFLTRLQRRIAEEVITSDKTALYFCSLDGAESKAERLKLDESGNITNWPQGFFGDEMGERIAMTEAAMRRKGTGQP